MRSIIQVEMCYAGSVCVCVCMCPYLCIKIHKQCHFVSGFMFGWIHVLAITTSLLFSVCWCYSGIFRVCVCKGRGNLLVIIDVLVCHCLLLSILEIKCKNYPGFSLFQNLNVCVCQGEERIKLILLLYLSVNVSVTIIWILCVWIILVFLYSKSLISGFVRPRKWSSYFWCCTCLSMSLVTVIWINYINKLSLVFFPLKSELLCLSGWENMVKVQVLLYCLSVSPVRVIWIKFLYKLSPLLFFPHPIPAQAF